MPVGESPLAEALTHVKKRHIAKACGVDNRTLNRFAEGESRPAPWLARTIAAELAPGVEELFPGRGLA